MENTLARGILAASSVISGCPIKIVRNESNMVEATANEVFQALLE
jgi:adenylate kinase